MLQNNYETELLGINGIESDYYEWCHEFRFKVKNPEGKDLYLKDTWVLREDNQLLQRGRVYTYSQWVWQDSRDPIERFERVVSPAPDPREHRLLLGYCEQESKQWADHLVEAVRARQRDSSDPVSV